MNTTTLNAVREARNIFFELSQDSKHALEHSQDVSKRSQHESQYRSDLRNYQALDKLLNQPR